MLLQIRSFIIACSVILLSFRRSAAVPKVKCDPIGLSGLVATNSIGTIPCNLSSRRLLRILLSFEALKIGVVLNNGEFETVEGPI